MATMATTSAVRDIPTTSGRDNFTAVAARGVPVTTGSHSSIPLPTPPNSISPALPPHGLKAQLRKAKLALIESDLDLHDGQEEQHAQVQYPCDTTDSAGTATGSPPYDSSGAISPTLLAKFYLPEILLAHGPLAIRHIMGYLTTSVPGFAGIPPAKARRLVVGALEGRGGGTDSAGVNGDVEFEKVGWGRWDARRRGQPSRAARHPASTLGDASDATGIPIPRSGCVAGDRTRPLGTSSSSADREDSVGTFSHHDRDVTMLEDEADKMSLDGSASASCSEAPDDDMAMKDNPEDATDDEDWAAVGAAELRARSYQGPPNLSSNVQSAGRGVIRSFSGGMRRAPGLGNLNFSNLDFSATALGATSDAQEREAVEALLQLGSV